MAGCNILKVDGVSSLQLVNGVDYLIQLNCIPVGGVVSGVLATMGLPDNAVIRGGFTLPPSRPSRSRFDYSWQGNKPTYGRGRP